MRRRIRSVRFCKFSFYWVKNSSFNVCLPYNKNINTQYYLPTTKKNGCNGKEWLLTDMIVRMYNEYIMT